MRYTSIWTGLTNSCRRLVAGRRSLETESDTCHTSSGCSPPALQPPSASRAYLYGVCEALDRGEQSRKDAAAGILYTAEAATQSALDAIQLLGGNGYINDYPTGRLLRDAKRYEIGAGTSEVRRMLVGRELFADTA